METREGAAKPPLFFCRAKFPCTRTRHDFCRGHRCGRELRSYDHRACSHHVSDGQTEKSAKEHQEFRITVTSSIFFGFPARRDWSNVFRRGPLLIAEGVAMQGVVQTCACPTRRTRRLPGD